MAQVHDKNTAYLYVGCVDYATTKEYVCAVSKRAEKALGLTDATAPLINMPVDCQGVKQNYCYIWWDDARIRDYILSKDSTGICDFQGAKYSFVIAHCTAYLPETEHLVASNLISAQPLPDWFKEADLRTIFARFNVSNYFSCKITQTNKGPFAFVYYDRHSYDAVFALVMCKVIKLQHQEEEFTLVFKYASKNRRAVKSKR